MSPTSHALVPPFQIAFLCVSILVHLSNCTSLHAFILLFLHASISNAPFRVSIPPISFPFEVPHLRPSPVHTCVPSSLHSLVPACLHPFIYLCLHASIPPSVYICMPPSLHLFVPACLHSSFCLCLRASIPSSICVFEPHA